MSRFVWSVEKDRALKAVRGVSFDEVMGWVLVDIIQHPTRPGQKMYIFAHDDYCWVVPCVISGEIIFLKTIYRSRKFTLRYLRKGL